MKTMIVSVLLVCAVSSIMADPIPVAEAKAEPSAEASPEANPDAKADPYLLYSAASYYSSPYYRTYAYPAASPFVYTPVAPAYFAYPGKAAITYTSVAGTPVQYTVQKY